jgi:3-deoxy-manno-octulosonate cytidylyltransferase (CMP-KDO synthetase)
MPKKAVAIIPARFASTRFPGKPLALIKGQTLLERTYRQVLLCPDISRVIVATDDERIKACAEGFGAEVVMTSASCLSGTDRLAEVVRRDNTLLKASAIVNVQGDEPCVDPKTISKSICALLSDKNISIGTVVAPIKNEEELHNPNIVKCVKTITGKALYFSRLPVPGTKKGANITSGCIYFRHIGMYAFRPDFLLTFATLASTPLQQTEDLEMLRAMEHGYTIGVAEVEHHSPDVNTPQDIEEVTRWIESQSIYS